MGTTMIQVAGVVLALLLFFGHSAPASALVADEAAKVAVVKRCADIYHASGHPCACPSDPMRNGQACGPRSAHDRAGGASPVCSADEVTADLLRSPAEVEELCHYHGR